MMKPICRCRDCVKLFLTFVCLQLLVTIMLLGCSVAPSPPTFAPSTPHIEASINPPDPPSNLIGELVSQSMINLQWIDNSNNEDGFMVYRDDTAIATVDRDTTRYSDEDVTMGKTYRYSVKAYNDDGESDGCFSIVKTPTPPITVSIDYIGVISAHGQDDYDGCDGEVQLVVVITDGKETANPIYIPPLEEGVKKGFEMAEFQTKKIDERVYQTSSVGDYLKISIIAYDIDSKTEILDMLSMLETMGSMLGVSGFSEIKKVYSMIPEEDDVIGYYEEIWGPDKSWGIGQYADLGHDDLRLWLSIYSDTTPQPISKPSLLPDVRIMNSDIPPIVKRAPDLFFIPQEYTYAHTLTLVNNESIAVTVDWKAHSSVTGNFAEGSISVPAQGRQIITGQYFYKTLGEVEITYTISYRGVELDNWRGVVNVIS